MLPAFTHRFSGSFAATVVESETKAELIRAVRGNEQWTLRFADGSARSAAILVNAAGAWADRVAAMAGATALAITPKRRTMVQLRIGRAGLRNLPLVDAVDGTFYFKGESDNRNMVEPARRNRKRSL